MNKIPCSYLGVYCSENKKVMLPHPVSLKFHIWAFSSYLYGLSYHEVASSNPENCKSTKEETFTMLSVKYLTTPKHQKPSHVAVVMGLSSYKKSIEQFTHLIGKDGRVSITS